jgi:hypothetical protein
MNEYSEDSAVYKLNHVFTRFISWRFAPPATGCIGASSLSSFISPVKQRASRFKSANFYLFFVGTMTLHDFCFFLDFSGAHWDFHDFTKFGKPNTLVHYNPSSVY